MILKNKESEISKTLRSRLKICASCLKHFKCHVSKIFHAELYLNHSLRNIYLINGYSFNLVVIVAIISNRQSIIKEICHLNYNPAPQDLLHNQHRHCLRNQHHKKLHSQRPNQFPSHHRLCFEMIMK